MKDYNTDYISNKPDEEVSVSIRLILPASNKALPPPAPGEYSSFSLSDINGNGNLYESDEDEDGTESNPRPPKVLLLLLQCLRVSLEATYVPPKLSKGPSDAAGLEANSGVVPSVDNEDAAYQSILLDPERSQGEATTMFKQEWGGSSIPPEPASLQMPLEESKKQNRLPRSGGDIWFSSQDSANEWIVEWRCQIPVVFLRSRHPTPALVLSSALTLQLQPSQLSGMAPSLLPPSKTSATETLFLHDLLNPLSEGPSYPDESPAERAARADASLAKLPLGKLPSSILGSKLVTPARSAKEVGEMVKERRKITAENGDMGDMEYNSLRVGKRDFTDEGLLTLQDSQGEDRGLGEEVIILRRSARRVLGVRSAVLVRMRTTNIACVGEAFGNPLNSLDTEDQSVPTLILCVEIENPANSGVKFFLDKVHVQVTMPSEHQNTAQPQICAQAVCIGSEPKEFVVERGSQHNLLYRVQFQLPYSGTSADGEDFDPTALLQEAQRTIAIRISGKPILLSKDDEGVAQESTPTETFTSIWSCTLDFSTQVHALILQRVISDGAGGYSLGRPRDLDRTLAVHQEYSTPLPSVLAARRIESMQSSQFAPREPYNRPSVGRMHSEVHSSMTREGGIPSAPRPPLRSATGTTSDTFVSLQRSSDTRFGDNMLRQGSVATTAIPSNMIGPSILARARKNRATTATEFHNGSSSQNESKGRRSTLVASPRLPSESTVMPSRGPSGWHQQKPSLSEADVQRNQVLPLGTKALWPRCHQMIRNAGTEQGLLVDMSIGAVAAHDSDTKYTLTQDYCSSFEVHLQVENRSENTRTLLVRWKLPKQNQSGTVFLPHDDAIQIGPIGAAQAEVTSLRLSCTSKKVHEQGAILENMPALVIIDVPSGTERILVSGQSLVI